MDDAKELNAKTFSRFAIVFPLFSITPDEKVYELICKIASPLKLEVPDYNELIAERLYGMAAPPEKWFEGPEGGLRRYYFKSVGSDFLPIFELLTYDGLLTFDPKDERDMQILRALRAQFRTESLPMEFLNDYLTYLNTLDAEKNMKISQIFKEYYEYLEKQEFSESYRESQVQKDREYIVNQPSNQVSLSNRISKLIKKFYTELQKVTTKDRLQFNALESASPDFDKDIADAIEHMLEEASECYTNQCYLATIMLCGKVTETLIKYVYTPVTGNEIYTINKKGEQIERTFKNMCYDLRSEGILLSRGVGERLDIIYAHRSGATHEIRIPSKDEAGSVALLTNDVMKHIFEYCNTHSLKFE